tara:strand:- start:1498 stop:2844 length:1347 start_codon:yes stop_codon:yes gene_type:complete
MSGGIGGGESGVSEEMLTTKGDTHGYTTENARVPIGSDTQVLTADSAESLGLKWATPTDIAPPTTTKGDLSGFSTLQARIPIGVDATVLTADSTQALGLAWAAAGGGVEYSQLTTSTTFTPTQQTGLVKVTVDGTDMTTGNIDVKVDGVIIKNVIPTEFDNRVLNPATSLSIISNDSGYSISTASYDSVSFSVNSQEATPHGMAISSDGTKMYIVGTGNKTVYQYTLSTAWDMSTASYDSVSFSISAQEASPYELTFKTDGTKMYVMGITSDKVHQYTLSTAWDLSTASYDSVFFSVAGESTVPLGLAFKTDGTKMYVMGNNNDTVFQYTLSTAWDLSTASYDSVSFSVASQASNPAGITFKPDGTKMYISGITTDKVYQYTLSTVWDLSTASYDSIFFSTASQDTSPISIVWKSDGTRIYVLGSATDTVYQYSTVASFAGTARISVG